MEEEDEAPALIVTGPVKDEAERLGLRHMSLPDKGRQQAQDFLSRWAPDMGLWLGPDLTPIVLSEAERRGVPMVLIESGTPNAGWRPGAMRRRLAAFAKVLAATPGSAARLRRAGAINVEMLGRFEDVAPAPSCDPRELSDMTGIIAERPIWLALDVPPEEIDAVLDAHRRALRRAHRLMLVLVPDRADDPAIQTALTRSGLNYADRAAGQDPEEQHQVLLSDIAGETGLWLRLAPVAYMGGTLSDGATQSPMAAAALGTAAIHGRAVPDPLAAEYRLLASTHASWPIRNAEELAEAVASLIAPDQAADLATAAWAIATEGAASTNRVTEMIGTLRDDPTKAL